MLLNDKPSTSASAIGPSLTCTPNSPVDPPVRPFREPKEGRHYVEVYVVKNGLEVARMTMRSLSGDRLFCRERRNGGGASWL
jgi:hypothetical protein